MVHIMINSPYRKKPALIIYLFLIISLPFFSIRHESFPGSISFIFLIVIFLFTIIKVVFLDKKIKKIFGFLDFLIFIYVIYSLFSFLFQNIYNEIGIIHILKTIVYFLLYLTLKYFISVNNQEEIARCTLHGILSGTLLFLVLVVYSLYVKGILGSILEDISYRGFTYKIYGALSSFLVGTIDYRSKDIMRSSLGEVFSFYFIAMIVLLRNTKFKSLVLSFIPINFFYVIASFSRRSLLSATISPIIFLLTSSKKIWIKVVTLSFLLALIYVSLFVIISESRLTDMSDTNNVRTLQYSLAIDKFSEKPILGYGYGAKIGNDLYVHNFVIASAYMIGIFGLIISLYIYCYLIFSYIRGLYKDVTMQYSFLLIIPILGLTVGSTVEGIFTIPSWIIIALYTSILPQNNSYMSQLPKLKEFLFNILRKQDICR